MALLAASNSSQQPVWIGIGILGLVVLLIGAYRWNDAVTSGATDRIPRFRLQTIGSAILLVVVLVRLLAHAY